MRRDPSLLRRTFTIEEIYPPELRCHDEGLATHGAAVDADSFGGHTALIATVVSQPSLWMNHIAKPQVAPFTQLLLDHGADPNARASLRKRLHPGYGPNTLHEYRDVTPLSWGERFHRMIFVGEPAMRLIREQGGRVRPSGRLQPCPRKPPA